MRNLLKNGASSPDRTDDILITNRVCNLAVSNTCGAFAKYNTFNARVAFQSVTRTFGKIFGTVAALLLLSGGIAHAEEEQTYLGYKLGNCHNEADFPGVVHGADSEDSQCFGLLAGKRYSWGALQARYDHHGTFWIRNTTDETIATIQSIGFDAILKRGPVFLKVGVESWQSHMTFNGTPEKVGGFGMLYGVGAEFEFNPNATIRVGFDNHSSIYDARFNDKKGVTDLYVAIVFETKVMR